MKARIRTTQGRARTPKRCSLSTRSHKKPQNSLLRHGDPFSSRETESTVASGSGGKNNIDARYEASQSPQSRSDSATKDQDLWETASDNRDRGRKSWKRYITRQAKGDCDFCHITSRHYARTDFKMLTKGVLRGRNCCKVVVNTILTWARTVDLEDKTLTLFNLFSGVSRFNLRLNPRQETHVAASSNQNQAHHDRRYVANPFIDLHWLRKRLMMFQNKGAYRLLL